MPGAARGKAAPTAGKKAAVKVDPERASRFIREIRDLTLGDAVEKAIEAYERVGQRNAFLWRWARRGVEITSLSCVDAGLWDHVCDTKTLGVMFDVLLDDVADASTDEAYLERLIDITENRSVAHSELAPEQREHFEVTRSVWNTIWTRIEAYPRFAEFRDVLVYDYRQLMNSMRFSMLLKKYPWLNNVAEHNAYLPHNMHMMVSGTIDLMASPGFDIGELGRLRATLVHAQRMGRIGNLVTTWEREVTEGDFSSGVFAVALSRGVLTVEDLQSGDRARITKRIRESDIEEQFLRGWRRLHDDMVESKGRFRTVDIGKLVEGLETLIQLHLGSRGLK